MANPSNGRWDIDRGTAGRTVEGRTSQGAYDRPGFAARRTLRPLSTAISRTSVADRDLMLPASLTKRLVNHSRPQDVTAGYAAD